MKQALAQAAALAARTRESEHRIHDRALEREREVLSRLDAIRPTAMADDESAREYQTLTMERARLAHVIETARQRLAA